MASNPSIFSISIRPSYGSHHISLEVVQTAKTDQTTTFNPHVLLVARLPANETADFRVKTVGHAGYTECGHQILAYEARGATDKNLIRTASKRFHHMCG
jgi:hypothetical protein